VIGGGTPHFFACFSRPPASVKLFCPLALLFRSPRLL
jgi:hypothetical protein